MPLTTATISGYLTKTDGAILANGVVAFVLSGVAWSDNHIVSSQKTTVETDSNGFFSINLMPNSAFEYPTSYNVTGMDIDVVTGKPLSAYDFGSIRVPVGGADIQDLMPVPNYRNTDTITIIKGDTIYWSVVHVDDIRRPVDLSAATIACKFIHASGATEIPVINNDDAARGKFIVSANTSNYLLGDYSVRIVITNGGITKTQIGKMKVIN